MATPARIDNEALTVYGGHLPDKTDRRCSSRCALTLQREEVDEKTFVTLCITNPRVKSFLGNMFDMYNLMRARRNKAVEALYYNTYAIEKIYKYTRHTFI